MSTIISHKYFIRNYLALIFGVFLCVYFAFHVSHGQRGFAQLNHAKSDFVEKSNILDHLQKESMALEVQVASLRATTLDKDVLEERVRHVLGYKHPLDIELVAP